MRDNQPKHRQLARERAKAECRKASRVEVGSALLVCEGECTEPFYLSSLLTHLGIGTVSVEIVPGQSKSNAVAVKSQPKNDWDFVFGEAQATPRGLSRLQQ